LVAAVAPYITKTRAQRWKERVVALGKTSTKIAQTSPHMVIKVMKTAVAEAPAVAKLVAEDLTIYREFRANKKAKAQKAEPMDAAAEE
jgi:hypothetical protein